MGTEKLLSEEELNNLSGGFRESAEMSFKDITRIRYKYSGGNAVILKDGTTGTVVAGLVGQSAKDGGYVACYQVQLESGQMAVISEKNLKAVK